MAIRKHRAVPCDTKKNARYHLVKVSAGSKHCKLVCARRVSGHAVRTITVKSLTEVASFGRAVQYAISNTKKRGNPVARYDVQLKRAYLEYPDGKKVYVE